MIWLTWRQFRIQALIGLTLLAAILAVYVSTRGSLLGLARDMGYAGCTDNCSTPADQFLSAAKTEFYGRLLFNATLVLFAIPGLIGLFWGAPLIARELETGTHRLVWNQTVTRGRWLAVKLGGVGLASMAVAGLASWAITAWASPLDRAGGWMEPTTFSTRGVVPIGYAAFAFAVGVTAGMLLRRTVPAMAVTLVVVVLAFAGVVGFLRPHLSAQSTYQEKLQAEQIGSIGISGNGTGTREMRVEADAPVPGAWVLSNKIITSTGAVFRGPADASKCGPDAAGTRQDCTEWIASQNLQQKVMYVGAEKFWTLQWRELGVFLVASALLVIFCFWWIRRRVA
jgi:ABC-type transport system involved in multi-copper enzyme maturation permease subunit